MTRSNITPTELVHASGVDVAATPVTIDATLVTNGVRIVGGGAKRGPIILIVANTAGSAKTVTVQSGGMPDAGTTDLVKSVALTSGVQAIAIDESALYAQADQSYWVDFQTGFTGTITVYRAPA